VVTVSFLKNAQKKFFEVSISLIFGTYTIVMKKTKTGFAGILK